CRAEQVPGGVGDQAANGVGAVRAIEANQYFGSAVVPDAVFTISNTVPGPFGSLAPPRDVVPNRSPAASAIRPPIGLAPSKPWKLTRVLRVTVIVALLHPGF